MAIPLYFFSCFARFGAMNRVAIAKRRPVGQQTRILLIILLIP
ncbi:MAG: hypothetical protein AB1861_02955 [Cyanobacteriota bacterium]